MVPILREQFLEVLPSASMLIFPSLTAPEREHGAYVCVVRAYAKDPELFNTRQSNPRIMSVELEQVKDLAQVFEAPI